MFRKLLIYFSIACFTATGLMILIVVLFPLSPEEKAAIEAERHSERELQRCEDSILARHMSQDFVKRQLAAPASAEFPPDYSARYLGDCRHEVVAAVDAQNVFGAKLRARYVATLRYDGDGRWSAERVEIVD